MMEADLFARALWKAAMERRHSEVQPPTLRRDWSPNVWLVYAEIHLEHVALFK